jgi:hypothetical protein
MDKLTQTMAYALISATDCNDGVADNTVVCSMKHCVSSQLYVSTPHTASGTSTSTTIQVVYIPKYAAKDTTLSTKNSAGEIVTVPVPAGTSITIHAAGVHYNRKTNVSLAGIV